MCDLRVSNIVSKAHKTVGFKCWTFKIVFKQHDSDEYNYIYLVNYGSQLVFGSTRSYNYRRGRL